MAQLNDMILLETLALRFLKAKEYGSYIKSVDITELTSKSGIEAIYARGTVPKKSYSVEVTLRSDFPNSLPEVFKHELDGRVFSFFFQRSRPAGEVYTRTAKIL